MPHRDPEAREALKEISIALHVLAARLADVALPEDWEHPPDEPPAAPPGAAAIAL
jgi:hypothetical protein